jgi:hypothetical protein
MQSILFSQMAESVLDQGTGDLFPTHENARTFFLIEGPIPDSGKFIPPDEQIIPTAGYTVQVEEIDMERRLRSDGTNIYRTPPIRFTAGAGLIGKTVTAVGVTNVNTASRLNCTVVFVLPEPVTINYQNQQFELIGELRLGIVESKVVLMNG